MTSAAQNLKSVNARIDAATAETGRSADDVTLVVVSKTFDADAIRPVLAAGQRVFGENRVQEAAGKWPELKREFPDIELHLIGPLQTNKVRDAVALFDVIQTVDRPKLAKALADEMERTGRRPRLFVQVNTGDEDQKAGVAPGDAVAFVKQCREEFGLTIEGLMCIPPFDEEASMHFALLAALSGDAGLKGLSMGMSGDFETAVQFGATHVRVGSAIFGSRQAATA